MRHVSNLKAPVFSVDPQSQAFISGIRRGDFILKIDGKPPRDVIDCYDFLAAEGKHKVLIEREGLKLKLTLTTGEGPLGIQFETPVFDGVIKCNNKCLFCFVDQLPEGLAPELYVKDDDYRLSFLCGNFITLTNIGNNEIRRIIRKRISPLYVSLHATDQSLRKKIFGNRHSDKALRVLKKLLEERIEIHIQIVLLRGLNDGNMLDNTLNDIKERFPGVKSIGVVPVGISSVGKKRLPEKYAFDENSSLEVIERLERKRKIFKSAGPFASDEFFYICRMDVPSVEYYEDFPQLENGIGLARKFIDEWKKEINSLKCMSGRNDKAIGIAIVTSPMGEWVLKSIFERDKIFVPILTCENNLFGKRVNVSGLMPGRDVIQTIKRKARGSLISKVFIPSIALSNGKFIDGVYINEIQKECGVEAIEVESSSAGLARALREHLRR